MPTTFGKPIPAYSLTALRECLEHLDTIHDLVDTVSFNSDVDRERVRADLRSAGQRLHAEMALHERLAAVEVFARAPVLVGG